jgi:para-aminobenzoate synthetase component 1
MIIRDRQEAIEWMNRYGCEAHPFVFVVNYACNCTLIEEPSCSDTLVYNFNGHTNELAATDASCPARTPLWTVHPCSFAHYLHSFGLVHRHLLRGDSFLANLTCATPVTTDCTLREIYARTEAPYKLWLKNHFVSFSPESFVRINGRRITSYPMKGTIDGNLPEAEQQLLSSPKEKAEHATIVDLIRNDLSMVASHVRVVRYRYISRVNTCHGPLLQTSSEIEGLLPCDFSQHLGSILFRLLPAGSITGAPKTATVTLLSEAEGYDRGFYTGICGYFDGYSLDSAVIIRYVEQLGPGQMLFKSGGGITSQSDAASEYQEMIQKAYAPIR